MARCEAPYFLWLTCGTETEGHYVLLGEDDRVPLCRAHAKIFVSLAGGGSNLLRMDGEEGKLWN